MPLDDRALFLVRAVKIHFAGQPVIEVARNFGNPVATRAQVRSELLHCIRAGTPLRRHRADRFFDHRVVDRALNVKRDLLGIPPGDPLQKPAVDVVALEHQALEIILRTE